MTKNEKPLVMTFDDGFDGVRTAALPLLRRAGGAATVFVVAEKLGGTDDWNHPEPGEQLLNEEGVRELAANGWEIGSHGSTHRSLVGLEANELLRETAGSRAILGNVVGKEVVSFCYPFGAFDPPSVAAVREAGYLGATVIRSGISPPGDDLFQLKRIPVRGTDPDLDLSLALTRGRSKF
jgi:peptidoglycan/xylan/chitin deacetylase (PgdA/CDA1 family)